MYKTPPLARPAGYLTDWHAYPGKQNVPLIPRNARECTTQRQCCCCGSPLGLLNVAGIAGICGVHDEALTQRFHLAPCMHRHGSILCVSLFMCTSGGNQTIILLFLCSVMCMSLHMRTYSILCLRASMSAQSCVHARMCLDLCEYMSVFSCPDGGVCVSICECACVWQSYQGASADWLVESVLIFTVFKPLLSDQWRGKAPGPLVHTQTFLSVFPSSPWLFSPVPFSPSYYLRMGDWLFSHIFLNKVL